jgi:hypothetical protein
MPIDRTTTVDALHLDAVPTLDVDLGVAVIDLARVSFVDAYALTGLACFIASAARDGLPVRLVLPEHPDVCSWLSRMHLGDVIDTFEVDVGGGLPRVAERDRRDTLLELQRFDDSHGSDHLATCRRACRLTGRRIRRRPALQGRGTRGTDHRGGRGCGRRHPGVAPAPVRRHDRWRGHHAGDPMERLPRHGGGPRSGSSRGRRGGQGTRRRRLDPQRCGLQDDHARPGDHDRCVPSARYDCRCSVALPARQVT